MANASSESPNRNTPTLSAVVLTKNEAAMILRCLKTLTWCDAIYIVDQQSEDETVALVKKHYPKVKVLRTDAVSFAERRNSVLEQLKTEWVFYIDADERCTPTFVTELQKVMSETSAAAVRCPRQNMMYGRYVHGGGWESETVTRIFRRDHFKGWTGEIHESPQFNGELIDMVTPLVHFTHRNTLDGLHKTVAWTPLEAELLAQYGDERVSGWTLVRKATMEVIRRFIFQGGYRDGMSGWVEALVQGMNRFLVYVQVWERQQQPSLPKRYENEEERIERLWEKSS